MMKIKCENCGAEFDCAAGEEPKCPFCGTLYAGKDGSKKITASAIPGSDYYIPFTRSSEALDAAARDFMTTGFTTPDDLVLEADITGIERFYCPVYRFAGEYETNWTASFGYDRKEQYKEYDKVNKRYVQKTRTVTDWKPFRGVVRGNFNEICPASIMRSFPTTGEALNETEALECARTAAKTELSDAKRFSAPGVAGIPFAPVTLSANDSWSTWAKEKLEKEIANRVKSNAQGEHQKNWNWTTKTDHEPTLEIAVPLARVTYTYKGETYHAYVHGSQTVAGGILPVDPSKAELEATAKTARSLACLAPVAGAVGGWIGFSSPSGNFLWMLFGVGVGALYAWGMRAYIASELEKVHANDAELRNALLLQRRAQDGRIVARTPEEREAVKASFALPERYKHSISKKIIPTLVASAVAAVIGAMPALEGQDASATPQPTQTAQTQPTRQLAVEQRPPVNHTQMTTQASDEERVAQIDAIRGGATTQTAHPVNTPVPVPEDAYISTTEEPVDVMRRLVLKAPIGTGDDALETFFGTVNNLPQTPRGDSARAAELAPTMKKAFEQNDYLTSLELLVQMTNLDPGDASTLANLGIVSLMLGNVDDALYYSLKAAAQNPYIPAIWSLVGKACERKGNSVCWQNAEILKKAVSR